MYNPNNAMKFYEKIRPILETDMDLNGRRVLAYFQYYVLKRPDLAEITLAQADKAEENVKAVLSKTEQKYEQKLIEELRENMRGNSSPTY
ncbi:MAG: hypothetical protein IKS48_03865 [Eubacterium sp.]|nr:hypothetical protein [Eubacterium sp.]